MILSMKENRTEGRSCFSLVTSRHHSVGRQVTTTHPGESQLCVVLLTIRECDRYQIHLLIQRPAVTSPLCTSAVTVQPELSQNDLFSKFSRTELLKRFQHFNTLQFVFLCIIVVQLHLQLKCYFMLVQINVRVLMFLFFCGITTKRQQY